MDQGLKPTNHKAKADRPEEDGEQDDAVEVGDDGDGQEHACGGRTFTKNIELILKKNLDLSSILSEVLFSCDGEGHAKVVGVHEGQRPMEYRVCGLLWVFVWVGANLCLCQFLGGTCRSSRRARRPAADGVSSVWIVVGVCVGWCESLSLSISGGDMPK